ncbi:hypothetical protein Aduo_000235 [Ancylostoma duodenale]
MLRVIPFRRTLVARIL